MRQTSATRASCCFEVRFDSLFDPGRALAFPSDSQGRVELEGLSEHARANYLLAMATVGREYGLPRITERPDECGTDSAGQSDPSPSATLHARSRNSRSIWSGGM